MNTPQASRDNPADSGFGMAPAPGAGFTLKSSGQDTKMRPYPGLRPFNDTESHLFFGRDPQVQQIIERMERHHMAAVMGGSGCGKSSIVRAGVIPKLHAYGISSAGDTWLFAIFTPQDQPIVRLAEALEALLEKPADEERRGERREQIRELLFDPDGLEYFLEEFGSELAVGDGLEKLRERTRLLVIVDQFEEIFRDDDHGDEDLTSEQRTMPESKPREAKALAELILNCFRKEPEADDHGDGPRARVFIMITLRTEDLHKCAEYLELPEVLNRCSYMARRLDENELERVIKSPPAMIARQAEVPGADERVLKPAFDTDLLGLIYDDLARNKSDPDHLPLLQHLLYRLWECAQRREFRDVPARITLQDLDCALNPGSLAGTGSVHRIFEGRSAESRSAYRNLLARVLPAAMRALAGGEV